MDRPSGPLGAATQSSRPMIDNGAPRPAPLTTARRVPPTNVRPAPSSSFLPAQTSISEAQVILLAEKAMKNALDEHEKEAAQNAKAEGLTVPGVTIDLSHKQIQVFPEEVVDIIKKELERLALSHNQISTFPDRFSECTSLRYLNVRNNAIREFPDSICELKSLEILDLGRNKLKVLPDQIARLTSLKVLSVQKNRLEVLPMCIADMASLQILKLEGNPLRFPPKELLALRTNGVPYQENEVADIAATAQVKKFMKQKATNSRSETESGGEESSEGTETPRPVKRVMSGRFPVKVNGTDMPDLRSPAFAPRPPPIPSRSHYRGLSQQNAALRRPGVMPLTIGSANERVRSNSEGLLPASRDPKDRSAERSRRMGIVSRKAQELGTVDEMKTNNRYSHYRGLSHGSAMQVGTNGNSRSPASPADSALQRDAYVKRLSSLPERKRESKSVDPVIEAAKSILYALFQVHPLIQNLLGVARDGTDKRTSLERVCYFATQHVEQLDRHIQKYDTYTEEDEEASPRSNENVHRTCVTCVSAYMHVCSLLQRNVQALLNNGDPRYIRSLLLNVYGSIAEVRNASEAFLGARQAGKEFASTEKGTPFTQASYERSRVTTMGQNEGIIKVRPAASREDRTRTQVAAQPTNAVPTVNKIATANAVDEVMSTRPVDVKARVSAVGETPRARQRERSVTPTHERPGLYMNPMLRRQSFVEAQALRLETNYAPGQPFHNQLRAALMTATPRSGDSFASSISGSNTMGGDFTEEDKIFEEIYLDMVQLIQLSQNTLPLAKSHFILAQKLCLRSGRPETNSDGRWFLLIYMCDKSLADTEILKTRLSNIMLKDPSARSRPLWQSFSDFVINAIDLLTECRSAKRETNGLITPEVISLLYLFHKAIKTTSKLIESSPWSALVNYSKNNNSHGVVSPASQVPLPMTPQSAALGPAVQATVPSTPRNASFSNTNTGNDSERSDSLTSGFDNIIHRDGSKLIVHCMLSERDGSKTPVVAVYDFAHPKLPPLKTYRHHANLNYGNGSLAALGTAEYNYPNNVAIAQDYMSPALSPSNTFVQRNNTFNGNGSYNNGGGTPGFYERKPNN